MLLTNQKKEAELMQIDYEWYGNLVNIDTSFQSHECVQTNLDSIFKTISWHSVITPSNGVIHFDRSFISFWLVEIR